MNKLFEGIRIAVVIPHHEFTGRGQEAGGHISHFKGVVKGFIENGCSVTTFARDPNSRCVDIEDSSLHIEVRGLSRVSYLYNLFCELYRVRKSFDLIYIRHSLGAVIFYPFFCLIFRRSEKVVELNSFTSRSAFSLYFEKRSLCFFDKIVAVSERLKESIPSGLQLSAIVVPNGVDLDRFQPKNSKPVLDAGLATVFGFVGTLKPGYGIEKLLAMYLKADFKNSVLKIAGNGPLLSDLKSSYSKARNIVFVGQVEFDKVPDFLRSCDILVYPGDQFIDFQSPIKIYEYLASGKPILAANVNGLGELLGQGSNQCGLIFDHNDFKDFIDKATSLIESRSLRQDLGRKAIIIAQQHSWSSKVQKILSFSLLGRDS